MFHKTYNSLHVNGLDIFVGLDIKPSMLYRSGRITPPPKSSLRVNKMPIRINNPHRSTQLG